MYRARRVLVGGVIATFAMIFTIFVYLMEETHWTPAEETGYNGTMARTFQVLGTDSVVFKGDVDDVLGKDSVCRIPLAGFNGWRNRMVTLLEPVIKRNCTKLFAGDQEEIRRVSEKSREWHNGFKDGELLKRTRNCTWVADYFHDNLYATKLERSFPIAYSFVVYDNPQQVLRLLRFLYRPRNVYCIHPDKKSKMMFDLFSNVAACLKNIMIPSSIFSVTWGDYSLLQAQMSCLTDLVRWRSKQSGQEKWKYVINLCGKEAPLVSTHTTVSYLSKLNGTSSIIAWNATNRDIKRLKGRHLPHNLSCYKSLAYMALSFQFAHFFLTNSTAIEFYQFFDGCRMPEEHFYATLYMLAGVPGGYDPSKKKLYFRISTSVWLTGHKKIRPPCKGRIVHSICIVTAGDLKFVSKQGGALFHNKYFMEDDHTIMDCMEERLVERNKIEYQEDCYP